MFAEKGKKQYPKLFSEAHLQSANRHKPPHPQSNPTPDPAKKLQSKSPSNQKLSSLSPRRKKLKSTTSRLFEAAHLPVSR